MPEVIAKVIYKPDPQSTEEYLVIVDHDQYKKWKEGAVVDSFQVFYSNQGNQGLLGKPSKQQLDTVFGTHKDDDVVLAILQKGKLQASEGISTSNFGTTNVARGSIGVNTRGKGNTGI
ncbi:Ribosome maturation protein SDO1/SBDS N-terminal domain-containing protein [Pleurotus pulmonarius]